MTKKSKYAFFLMTLFTLLFWYSHRNPTIAVRTKVFSAGYFGSAMKSKIEKTGVNLYIISPAPVEKETFSELKTYSVKKHWLFYFSDYYGEI